MVWGLHCKGEAAAAFLSAVDLSVPSPSPGEDEVLFPPLTMLRVHKEEGGDRGKGGALKVHKEDEGGDRGRALKTLPDVAATVTAATKSESLKEVLAQKRLVGGREGRFEKEGGGTATFTRLVATPLFV